MAFVIFFVFFVFVFLCIYVTIGGICAAIFDWTDEDDATACMVLFWPFIVPIICLIKLSLWSMHSVEKIISLAHKIKFKRRKTK